MRVLVVGLGTQGYKRREVAGRECTATVDPVNLDADYRHIAEISPCLLYTSPSPRDRTRSRMPSSA